MSLNKGPEGSGAVLRAEARLLTPTYSGFRRPGQWQLAHLSAAMRRPPGHGDSYQQALQRPQNTTRQVFFCFSPMEFVNIHIYAYHHRY